MCGGGALENDWIDDIVMQTAEACKGRKVVLWGKYLISESISLRLKAEYKIETAFYVDSDSTKQNGQTVKAPECLKGMPEKCFVIVPLAFYPSIKSTLEAYGYRKDLDYNYFCDCVLEQRDDYYEDAHGNKIIGNYQGLKFAFSGYGATLKIGDRCTFVNATVYMHTDTEMTIGQDCKLWEACEIYVRHHGSLNIGNRFTMERHGRIDIWPYAQVNIGNDCMVSWNLDLRTSDEHSIFDVTTGKNINSTVDICRNRIIKIGNHVWIGAGTTILYNTKIGDGSIIGTRSLVKGKIPNNCIAAGVPAKIIRRNVAWSRKYMAEDILECGADYIHMTEEID